MKQVLIKATFKPRYEIGRVYTFSVEEAKFLVENNYAEYVTEIKAPKSPLIELETEININSQVEVEKPVKRTKKGK